MRYDVREKLIASAEAFLGERRAVVGEIIRACGLRPDEEDQWKTWVDDLGNSIKIYKNKEVKSFHHTNKEKITSDLYFQSTPLKHCDISTKAVIFEKEDEYLVWFWGIDKRLRLVSIKNEGYQKLAPLSYGFRMTRDVMLYMNSNIAAKKIIDTNYNGYFIKDITIISLSSEKENDATK
jgi:hypothetical protein